MFLQILAVPRGVYDGWIDIETMKSFLIRYSAMRTVARIVCSEKDAQSLRHGVKIAVRTLRGLELGTIVCEASLEQIQEMVFGPSSHAKSPDASADSPKKDSIPQPEFVRVLTDQDKERIANNKAREKEDYIRCLKTVHRFNVALSLVKIERILGGERLIVYYVAEGRVDFRELVRSLAAEFQTRIEMKQIGVRDATKLREVIGDCGREVCCNTFLIRMPSVAMKVAKLQVETCDPSKISGHCGRLKCCMRYENDCYCELQRKSPAIGSYVSTEAGVGRVVDQQLLAQKVVVEILNDNDREGRRVVLPTCEVRLLKNAPQRKSHKAFKGKKNATEPTEAKSEQTPSDESTVFNVIDMLSVPNKEDESNETAE